MDRMTRTAAFRAFALATVAATALACSSRPDAEDPGEGEAAPGESEAAITEVVPQSGPPGTDVRVRAAGFPANTMVEIGFGPPNSEYSVLETARTDAQGGVSVVVEVPDWAETGRGYVFVVAGTDRHDPKAISGTFQVTAGSGQTVRVEGRVTDEGVECLAIRGDDGKLYTLAGGDTAGLRPGDRVVVEGTVAEASFCMQGTTISVRRIEKQG